jgi:hypothetical protein
LTIHHLTSPSHRKGRKEDAKERKEKATSLKLQAASPFLTEK